MFTRLKIRLYPVWRVETPEDKARLKSMLFQFCFLIGSGKKRRIPTLLLQQTVIWGNMMVCCAWFAGFQPFYYIRKLRCGRIWWYSTTSVNWDVREYDGLLNMVCWFPTILLHQKIEMRKNMMVCCTWFAGFQTFYYISKLRCEGIWWFSAHGLMVSSHSTTSANWDVRTYDGLLQMVCLLPTILQYYSNKFRSGGKWWFAGFKPSSVPHQQIKMRGNMMVCCTWFADFPPF